MPSAVPRLAAASSALFALASLSVCPSVVHAFSTVYLSNHALRHAQYTSLRSMGPDDTSHQHRDDNPPQDPPLWATWKNIEATRRQQQQHQRQPQQSQRQHIPPPQPLAPEPPLLPVPPQSEFRGARPWSRNEPQGGARDRIPAVGTMSARDYNRYRTVPDKDISNIFRQNQEWKHGKLQQDPFFFNKLGSIHKPRYMWIGCSDARVAANEIMGEDAGSVFVVRNVANLVVNTDFNLMSALQYAVNVLQVEHIIVCGHYDCGGVRASLEKKDHSPPLENWLRNIRDVYRLHREELNDIRDPEHRHRRLVELNVVEQCLNLFKTGAVQRRRVETFRDGSEYTTPRIHACVFDPRIGYLNRLPVDFKQIIRDLHTIYDLYTLDESNSPGRGEIVPSGGRTYYPGSGNMAGKAGSLRIRSDGPSDVSIDFSFDEDGNIRFR